MIDNRYYTLKRYANSMLRTVDNRIKNKSKIKIALATITAAVQYNSES